jgi:GH25 family lysozyme M1 (1,4-beta-N-acetylmuramidase)
MAMVLAVFYGCGSQADKVQDTAEDIGRILTADADEMDAQEGLADEPVVLDFVDTYGETHQMKVNPNVAPNVYNKKAFVHNGSGMSYGGEDYNYRLGIDVSHYQGEIDWEKVKASGIEFVFIRLGYRGYGEEGVLKEDSNFEKNIQGARSAGLDVGVYFFAQAVNEKEAIEEAQFVLDSLLEYNLQMPVVYDPESILHEEARTDHVTGEQFTKNTKAFCETIEEAGYDAMIYCNMLWQADKLDLTELSEYPIWYADYEEYPQTPYHFEIWQYSNEGTVDGIQGNVDLNIQMITK